MDETNNLLLKEPGDTNQPDNNETDKKTEIIEGLSGREEYGFIIGLLVLVIPLTVYCSKNIYSAPYTLYKSDFEDFFAERDNDDDNFTKLYDEYLISVTNNKMLNHKWVLMSFIGFAYIAFLMNIEDGNHKEPTKLIMASIVGASVFIFKFIPSVMSFFENVFGYFFMNLFGAFNLSLWLKNEKFNNEEANIKLNKLMLLFNVENLGVKFNQIGLKGDTSKINMFATYADQTKYNLFEELLNASILKRVIGEVSLLIVTALISISILHKF